MHQDVSFSSGDVTLAGTLWLPAGSGPHPGVVMVGGSGPTDRDNDVLFPPIRAHLLSAGFAVLSYDKRGVGGSSGNWLTSSYGDLAADAAAAVRLLRSQPQVDTAAVGLFGHSEGGWVVLRAAAQIADLAYVVTNSGPGVSLARQDRWATANALRADGATPSEIAACEATHDQIMRWAGQGVAFAEMKDVLDADPAYQRIIACGPALTEDSWEFVKLVHNHDPSADLIRLRCPHLALFGAAETVVPVAASVTAFATAACNRPDPGPITMEIFPDADHRIRIGDDFAPGYLATLTRWLSAAQPNR
ncbi:alpha/beta fold hydrolase [Dactylosporangium sp. AC04546]|uniref:alpha/beta hydrolase family protein n=1 Tax=Dactylosporangium sp. AC04546 TaxID=2862460 RepID=UPI001EE08E5C|nr:alpha/beta hydrolase [Dactylosporangium sp. AC04546]WVK86555.1 alpha/beta fold hydrolase [Dactylosporangium sp. AC04546]